MDKKETVKTDDYGYTTAIHDWSPIDESGKHKSSMDIEHDIEETRHSMDLILDTLNGKASPGSLYNKVHDYFQKDENRERVRKTLSKVSNSVSSSFQRNPLPVMMIAAGASWMFWEINKPSHDGNAGEQAQRIRGEAGERFETAKEEAGMAKQKAREKIENAKERTGTIASEAQRKAGSFFDQASQQGKEYQRKTSDLQDRAKYSYQKADNSIHNNPLLFGVAAACAGILTGMLIPETRVENQYTEDNKPDVNQNTANISEKIDVSEKLSEKTVAVEKPPLKKDEITLEPDITGKKVEEKPNNPLDKEKKQ